MCFAPIDSFMVYAGCCISSAVDITTSLGVGFVAISWQPVTCDLNDLVGRLLSDKRVNNCKNDIILSLTFYMRKLPNLVLFNANNSFLI